MNAILSLFVAFLLTFVGGVIALAVAVIIIMAVIVYTYKAVKLFISLLNAAIREPEEKLAKKVRILNGKIERPAPWPNPPKLTSKKKKVQTTNA